MLRAASLRPASRAFIQTRRQQSTNSPSAGNRTPEQGQETTEKVYEKNSTNPNKNLVFLGVAALGLGGYYAFYTGRAEQAVNKAEGKINEKSKR